MYWYKSFLKKQQEAFDLQIRWANEKKLPIVIHCRDAFDEVFEVLQGYRSSNLSGIFDCFTGTKEQAEMVIDMKLKLGIGGVVTFKNGKINKFLDQISILVDRVAFWVTSNQFCRVDDLTIFQI